jgi:eukaryotic-like serine/threonine-protein kinase
LYVESQLGETYVEEGKASQGIPLLEKTHKTFREVAGAGAPDTLREATALGWAYDSQGDLVRAQQLWESALDGYRRFGSEQEANAADVSELLGQNLTKQSKYAQAEPLLGEAVAFREKGNRDDWALFRAQAFLGATLAGLRRYAEAEQLLLSGYEGMDRRARRMPAKQKKWIRISAEQIVQLYSQWPRPDQAAQWRAKLTRE